MAILLPDQFLPLRYRQQQPHTKRPGQAADAIITAIREEYKRVAEVMAKGFKKLLS